MKSIQKILFVAFFAVTLVAVGTVTIVVLRTAASEIDAYNARAEQLEMTRIVHWLTGYFDLHETWADVQPYVQEISVMHGRRVVVTDRDGRVVGDTRIDETHLFDVDPWRSRPLRFRETDDPVGYVYVSDEATITDSFRARMASSIRLFLFFGSGLAVVLSLVVSLALTRQFAAPMKGLAAIADRAAGGDLSVRASVPAVRELRSFAVAFNRMMSEVDAAATLRRNMIADVAHELRTPLSNIRGYLEGRRDGVVTDEEAMTIVESESAVLARLIDDLQEVSLADSGTMELELQPVELRELVQRVARSMSAAAADHAVRLSVDLPDEPVQTVADPIRIAQVLSNLVSNAIIHSPPDGTVALRCRTTGEGVSLSVSDEGDGIPPEHLAFVFERLYRVDPSRSRETGGHGLGLTIARSIVVAHGGTIDVTSVGGHGSVFTVFLPNAPAERRR